MTLSYGAGVALVVMGLAAQAFQDATLPANTVVLDAPQSRFAATPEDGLSLPPLSGAVAVTAGVALLAVSRRGNG